MAKAVQNAALQEFFRWERQSWVEVVADIATDERAYVMPVETLRSYFKANDSRKLNKILSEVFQSEDIPVDPEAILRTHTAVFCILLRISKGEYIEDFVRFEELSDQRLPFDPAHPPACFLEAAAAADDDQDFVQRFCEKQWMYCVPVFDNHMLHKHFGRQRLLPITHKERCGGQSMAIYKIKLYGPHNKIIPAGSEILMNNTEPNTFILKRYLTKIDYRQEVKNFSSSKHSESIIRFYGSYTHGSEYNILLEYADKGSLVEYFQKQTPPSRGKDTIKFWDGLFQLIKALKAIHSILDWHQDVKPASVLVLSYGAESVFDWKFKLADFGLIQSINKAQPEGDAVVADSRGIQTYGAPECYMQYNSDDSMGRSSSKITQAVDIWSLGCVYSEAAIWIVDGYDGVVNYRRQRMAETDKIPNFKGGDCFHDGERVLKVVLDTHKDLELRLRRSDCITKDVLNSMAEEMLWEEDRPGAKALWRRAERVLSRARQRPSSGTAEDAPTRPSSNHRPQTYPIPLGPPHPPPERPLPKRPQIITPRPPSAQRQYPATVEMWRSQVRVPSGELASPVYGGEQRISPESISENDTDLTSSVSSWQAGNNNSLASPLTSPSTSPHVSSYFDQPRQRSVEGRRGLPQSQRSSGYQGSGKRPNGQSQRNTAEISNEILGGPTSSQLYAEFLQEGITTSPIDGKGYSGSVVDNARTSDRISQASSNAYSAPRSVPAVQAERPASPWIPEDPPLRQNSPKRSQGLSLFPTKPITVPSPAPPPPTFEVPLPKPVTNYDIPPPKITTHYDNPPPKATTHYDSSLTKTSTYQESPLAKTSTYTSSLTRSDSISNTSISTIPTKTSVSDQSGPIGHLSLTAALEWKKALKKSKKNGGLLPPVHGASSVIEKLKDRDHIFILDDSASMRAHWPPVKNAFSVLGYILKPMSPDGISLFFSVSYDTWRRHNTSELVDLLEKKGLGGETDISYRLGLQLQDWRAKHHAKAAEAAKGNGKKKKDKSIRGMSFYVLTDGNWKAGSEPTKCLRVMADYLLDADLKSGQVTVQFVTFGRNDTALKRIEDVVNTDFGLDLVDATPSTGNVLKMLCGALDKERFEGYDGRAGSASTLVLPLAPEPLPPIELA